MNQMSFAAGAAIEGENLLIELLARTDAIWLPSRSFAGPRSGTMYALRLEFRRIGVSWFPTAADETTRRSLQRLAADLAVAGLISVARANEIKSSHIRLTDVGEDYTRRICGMPSLPDAGRTVNQLKKLAAIAHHSPGIGLKLGDASSLKPGHRRWVPETALAGAEFGTPELSKKLMAIEDSLLPALVRGWVEARCTEKGHALYSLTELAARVDKLRAFAGIAPETSPDDQRLARGHYYFWLHRAQSEIAAAEPTREIGELPMLLGSVVPFQHYPSAAVPAPTPRRRRKSA